MGDPFGTVSITSYAGESLLDPPYDLSEGPYPTVILSPGFAVGTSAYAWLAEHLASYGFVVIAVEHHEGFDEELTGLWRGTITRPQDILDVVSYLDDQIDQAESFADLIDLAQVAVVGHSYGGYTALASAGAQIDTASFRTLCESAYESNDPNVFLCDEVLPHLTEMADLGGLNSVPEGQWPAWADHRIDAIIPLAGDALFFGQPGLTKINVPVMAIGGTLDSDSPYMWGTHPTYEYVSSPIKARIALRDAEHMIFTGPCERSSLFFSFFTGEFCSDTTWDRQRAHDLTNHFTTAFLLALFKEDAAAVEALRADQVDFPNVEFVSEGF
jgi:predicted dienelactone hydrolase